MGAVLKREPKLVSVVIPCYNHGEYVGEAVRSALAQAYRPLEVLVVNDGSDDPATLEALERIAANDATVLHKPNGHLSSARNHGIRHARGEYVMTLDADDLLEPDLLARAVPILEGDSEAGVVTTHIRLFDDEGPTGTVYTPSGGGVVDFLVRNQACGGSLFRAACWDAAGGYDESMRSGSEDWEFWIAVTSAGWKVRVVPEPLYLYRRTPDSMYERTREVRAEVFRYIVQKHEELFREHLVEVLYRREVLAQETKTRARQAPEAVRASMSYRLGAALLRPARWMRSLLWRPESRQS